MPQTRATTPSAMADKRDRILDAALELFAERGFYGTAMPGLARAAKVGAGTVYRYFDSKEALVNALYQREKHKITDYVMADFPLTVPAREQFHHFFARIVGYARAHRASFTFLEHHHHAAYLDEESRALEGRVATLAFAYLAQTAAARITKPYPPAVLAAVLWGAVIHLMKEAWAGRVTLDEAVLEQTETVLWEAIRL